LGIPHFKKPRGRYDTQSPHEPRRFRPAADQGPRRRPRIGPHGRAERRGSLDGSYVKGDSEDGEIWN
jgi:hypothetical protein